MNDARQTGTLRFLVATDLAPEALPHLQFAVRFGDAFDAHTTLFHAVLPTPLVVGAPLAPIATAADDAESSRARLREIVDGLDAKRPVHVAVESAGDARTATLAAAERLLADLVILPTHGRTGVQRALLGSTAEQIVRRAHLPVMLVTERMLEALPGERRDRGPILVATDLSPATGAAHREAIALAQRLGTWVLLASVLPEREPPPYGGGAPVPPQTTDPRQRVQEQLARMRQHAIDLEPDVPVEVQACIDDDVAGAVARIADEQRASVVVMATHGRRGLARLLKGSVTEKVARRSSVPVVCLPAVEAVPEQEGAGVG